MSTENPENSPEAILFFDGVCNLCNHFVDFVVTADRAGALKIASLQGATAKKMVPETLHSKFQSVVLIKNGHLYLASEAVWRVFELLPWPVHVLALIRYLPYDFRDMVYSFVARWRYRWFGVRASCRLPTAEEKSRFLD